ncbi:MAG: hypothetical protein ABWW66_06585 [Archaeoglobaceae archaeon]
MIVVDREKRLLVVKRRSVVDGWIRFDGDVVVGISSAILGGIEAKSAYVGKSCTVRFVKAREIVLGARTRFERLEGESVLLQHDCRGDEVIGKVVRISRGCEVGKVKGDTVILEGESRIKSVEALKVLATR